MWEKYPNFGRNTISWESWWNQVVKKTFDGHLPKNADINSLASELISDFKTTKCWKLAEVGHTKPDREIFDHALKVHMNACPAECLHIGDDLEKDFRGARAAGWHALLVTNKEYKDIGPVSCALISGKLDPVSMLLGSTSLTVSLRNLHSGFGFR
ncbi:unnamed protein product, partial [Iphiclides podalirius]